MRFIFQNMKGIVSKYYEFTPNPYFKERNLPDRVETPFPHWEICRPDYRKRLHKGDVVFFVTDKQINKQRVTTFCTGILVVKERVSEEDAKKILGEKWYIQFKRDISERSCGDRENRREDIIIGDKTKSKWLGKKGQAIEIIDKEKFNEKLREQHKIKCRNNVFLDEEEVLELYRILIGHKLK